MSWTRWLPLRFIIRKAAHSQGFLDPIELLARLRSFAQPSEVGEPVELLRAGAIFHARGLINSKVIQHNLDWVWPYWIEKQYDPTDNSFLPRAFAISHINQTHRNWTATGYPDCDEFPIVDPRGLLTPLFDGWSLDVWIVTNDGRRLLPSREKHCQQRQDFSEGTAIESKFSNEQFELVSRAEVVLKAGQAVCKFTITAKSDCEGFLVLALRPYNPEGISFVYQLDLSSDRKSWTVNEKTRLEFSEPVAKQLVSRYQAGDVFNQLDSLTEITSDNCDIGLMTVAACFHMVKEKTRNLDIEIPLVAKTEGGFSQDAWAQIRAQSCQLKCPDPLFQFLFDAALTSLVLHSPADVYPGPYTYKRFWFRDAAFIINALLCMGMTERAERAIGRFKSRQTPLGYFRSQEGEWDANGEVLWILNRYELLTGRKLSGSWDRAIERGAHWIARKRVDEDTDLPHAGLLPAGFSAEHLGLNDYYFWDDFWGVAGLEAGAVLLRERDAEEAANCKKVAEEFSEALRKSLQHCKDRLKRPAMPASPYRRLDAGAIGSLVVGYPLQLCPADDPGLLDCVEFLLENCFIKGAFFQDMIHSGLNAYLTLHVAQVLLRNQDSRYLDLMDTVAALATSTGQWPEAIHPNTDGGCMGDGHHVWASAEWALMIRNCFMREEQHKLILCAGIPDRWLGNPESITFGPAPTEFGTINIVLNAPHRDQVEISWQGMWHSVAPDIEVCLPGFEKETVKKDQSSVRLARTTMA